MLRRLWLPLAIWSRLLLASASVGADDWPHWRGLHRNDVVAEVSGFREGQWPISEAWRTEAGAGGSSPVVVGDEVFTYGWREEADLLTCLDAATGVIRWRQTVPAPAHSRLAVGEQNLYSGPSASPTYDQKTGRMYTLGADGDLRCWDARDKGRVVWQKNLIEKYPIPQRPKAGRTSARDYGFTSAPLVQGESVIVEVGAPDATLMAFDLLTGEEVWRSRAGGPAGHAGGPVPFALDGVPCVAVFRFGGLLVVRCDAEHRGETVCEIPWLTNYGNNVAGPSISGNSVLLTSEYNQAKISRYDLSLNQPPKLVWERAESSKVCSPVIHQGRAYWAWRRLHCLDFATGEPVLVGGETGDAGSIIMTGDERLISWTGQGDLRLIENPSRTNNEYRELAALPGLGGGDAWPHVVLANGRIYCKDRLGRLICVKIDK